MRAEIERAWRTLKATVMGARARCYRAVFDLNGPQAREAERVLSDLRDFCMAERTTFDPDPQLAAFRAGKREVWLRIQYFLNLTDAEVHRLVEVESDYDQERD